MDRGGTGDRGHPVQKVVAQDQDPAQDLATDPAQLTVEDIAQDQAEVMDPVIQIGAQVLNINTTITK